MSELFDIPESKSPRLIWMEEHEITTHQGEKWTAYSPLILDEDTTGTGDTELDAITDLARKLNLKLWNEQ